jgi:TRAP-type C4-dicarboxylate transport system substrate-binding protein
MNPASYDKLTDEQKAAIDAASGEAFARLAGKAWDAADDNGRKVATDNGIIIQTASDAFVAEIAKAASGVEAAWIEKANAKGVDAQAMLDEFKLIAKDVAKSN